MGKLMENRGLFFGTYCCLSEFYFLSRMPSYKGQKWPSWQSSNSTVIIDSDKKLKTDRSDGENCYQIYPYFTREFLPKLFPTDSYTIKEEIEFDRKQSYTGWLYDALDYLPFQNFF